MKLMENGNRAGIFTFVINNSSSELPMGMNREDYLKFVEKLKSSAFVLNKMGGVFTTETDVKSRYLPISEIGFDKITEIIKILSEKAKEGRHVFIPLTDMFAESDKKLADSSSPSAAEVIDIPIGKRGGEIQNILLDATGEGSAHAVVIGGTGSGKSNLLHTIIMSSCYKYSPDDLKIYLVDFKGGVEFKFYEANQDIQRQLPHIVLTGLTREPEDGVAILSNIRKELHRREDLFRNYSVEDIIQFCRKYPLEKIPRLLVIIDEVQELFERDDRLGNEAIEILSELFKKGRAFGISILWASQNVPKVAGLKDKVLSQIGNRISLRLNNPDEAMDIGIDPAKVKTLNRPEKGLGIISDIRTLTENVEFRVAYAYSSEERYNSTYAINNKWKSVVDAWKSRKPLFIVGNDDIPSSTNIDTKYMTWNKQSAKTAAAYSLNLGQDYITGDPYYVPLDLRKSHDNLWIAGSDIGEIRDIMGYALLSSIIDNTNLGLTTDSNIYYINGEYKSPEDPRDLYYVLPEFFPNHIRELTTNEEMIEMLRSLYLIRRERASNIQKEYSPIFVFIHKLQAYAELFRINEIVNVNEPYKANKNETESGLFDTAFSLNSEIPAELLNYNSSPSQYGSSTQRIGVTEIFKELFTLGADTGIHFILSMDSPQSVKELMGEFRDCGKKIVLKGVSSSTLYNILDTNKGIGSINKPGIAFYYNDGDLSKFKPYRYDSADDEVWLLKIKDDLDHFIGEKR